MSPTLHFYVTHLDSFFQIIGSADQDLLREMGVTLGSEFRTPHEDEEDEFFGDEKTEEPPDWDYSEEEADSAQEIIVKLIMSGIGPDLAEDEAYAIQDYLAVHARRDHHMHLVEPDDLSKDVQAQWGPDVEAAVHELLAAGIHQDGMTEFMDWMRAAGASHDLVVHLQMLTLGRLPEADEPTFKDLKDEAYSARFGFLYAGETARMVEEMNKLAPQAAAEHGAVGYLVAALLHYCASHLRDLVVTVEE